jgi:hypothetical protein
MSQGVEFTEVYCAANLARAGEVRELLERNGIDSTTNPTTPTFPWDGDVRVLCLATEAARARELIAAYFAQPEEGDDEGEEGEDEEDEDEEDEEEENGTSSPR